MAPWQERVVQEKAELDGLRVKLMAFLSGGAVFTLPLAERERLLRQVRAMSDYSDVLGERIDAFEGASNG